MDACGGGCGCGHHRDAWCALAARRGDLSRPAHLLRSRQLHLQLDADADVHRRTDELGECCRVRPISREEPAIDFVPADRLEQRGRGPARYSQRVHQQPVPRHARLALAGDGCESGLYPPAPGRRVKALWHDGRSKGRHGGNQAENRKLTPLFGAHDEELLVGSAASEAAFAGGLLSSDFAVSSVAAILAFSLSTWLTRAAINEVRMLQRKNRGSRETLIEGLTCEGLAVSRASVQLRNGAD